MRTTHKLLTLLAVGLIAATLSLLAGCDRDSAGKGKQLWTCGMHPQVIQDHPGNCPICGMKLTLMRRTGTQPAATNSSTNLSGGEPASVIQIDPVTTQNMGIRTAVVTRGPVRRTFRTVGVVDYNETAIAEVTTKFRGWIEKLYVDSTGKQMHRGEPLFEIYSPELYLAQTEFLLTLGSATETNQTAQLRRTAALTKLKYWDISDEQLQELEHSRQPHKTLRVTAPRDGIVTEKSVVEGQMVEAGAMLYRLADLSTVWVQAQVYEQDLPYIHPGQEATVNLSSQPEPVLRGKVTYLYPLVDEKTRTARIRLEFHNPGYFLKPGMYTTVRLISEPGTEAVLVPDMAVLRSGEKNMVFVEVSPGHFAGKELVLGGRANGDFYEVTAGLEGGERVVTSGQFLLDSESQLREAVQKMGQTSTVALESNRPGFSTNMLSEEVVYICPMPEHVALQYNHPGKCPLCNMGLVPVTHSLLEKIRPGGQISYYTCPMPEHSDVRKSGPGKCPRCTMTLVPVMTPAPGAATNTPAAPAERTNAPSPNPSTLDLQPATNANPLAAATLPVTNSALSTLNTQLSTALYTCPMASHADVVSDKPGTCTKCDMKLVDVNTVKHGPVARANWEKQHKH